MELFDFNTEKWWRLKEHLYGFDGKTKSLNKLITNLDENYPNTRKNTIKLSDIVKSINSLQSMSTETSFRKISESLNRSTTVIYEYLRKLEKLGILKTKKHGQRKYWFLSKEFPYPKRGE